MRDAADNRGERNPFYGRNHSEETKAVISRKNKGKMPPNARQVTVDRIVYQSCSEAARSLGVATATIQNRVNSDSPKFSEYVYV